MTAMIVGVTLIAINHGAAIITHTVTRGRILQMCLTVLVPYLVSTISSVATRKELAATQRLRNGPSGGAETATTEEAPTHSELRESLR